MKGAGIDSSQARLTADRVGKWFGEVIAVNNCTLSVGTGVVGLDPARWAAAIEAGLQHPDAAQRAVALERVRAHDWPVVLDLLCLRYLELLESHRRALRPAVGGSLSAAGGRVQARASALR